MRDIEQYVPSLDGMEVIITATVGERFLDEIIEGYSVARIYNSSINVAFLGGTPQVFKPAMPFDIYVSSYCLLLFLKKIMYTILFMRIVF